MSTEREQRREQRRAATQRRVQKDATPAGKSAIRSKPVRITLDLTPSMYERLTRAVLTIGLETGYKLSQAEVLRAMILALEKPEVMQWVQGLAQTAREMKEEDSR